ncbi:hypothetical protein Tco_0161035, partial [Tanacetum coccineum]
SALIVEEEIVEPAGEDSFDSPSTRDGIVRIVGIKTVQRWLEADQLIARGQRVSMIERIDSSSLENIARTPRILMNYSTISLSVFYVRSSDEESTPANDRFSKADEYHAVPPPITGNFLTPRADISFAGLDEYAIRKKIIKSKTTVLNTKTSETVGKTVTFSYFQVIL